jgi:apyrase
MKAVLLAVVLVLVQVFVANAEGLMIPAFRNLMQSSSSTCYGVLFDAGSSGTRIYVYKWPCRTVQSPPKIVVTEAIPNLNIKPGISSYASNATAAGESIKPLIAYAKTAIPENQVSVTPIYLRATAGMRLLTDAQQGAIYESIRATLRASGFRYDADDWSKTISGQEEGAFLWLAANYLYNQLNANVAPEKTRIVLDCGGASLQLAMVPPQAPPQNGLTIKFADPTIPTYNLYSYSWLGYGGDQARENVLKMTADPASPQYINSPCFNPGFNGKIAVYDPNVVVNGTGNPTACRELIRKYLNVTAGCSTCGINGVYRPQLPADIPITAVSSFYYAGAIFDYNMTYTPNQLIASTEAFCRLPYDQAVKGYLSKSTSSLLPLQCFQSLLVGELYAAFGIAGDKQINVNVNVGNVGIGWTLGSMFYDVGRLPCKFNTQSSVGESCAPIPSAAVSSTVSPLALLLVVVVVLMTFMRNL